MTARTEMLRNESRKHFKYLKHDYTKKVGVYYCCGGSFCFVSQSQHLPEKGIIFKRKFSKEMKEGLNS